MADERNIAKIIAGIVGVGIVGTGIAALINSINDDSSLYTPNYENPGDDDNVPSVDEIFESERIQREDSKRDDHQAEQMRDDYENGNFEQREIRNDIEYAQREFDQQSQKSGVEYLYIDFAQYLKSGSRNRNDVYIEPLEEQFEKVHRKLSLHGKNDITDLRKFVSLCFPSIKSTYYVSLPSFERSIETFSQFGQTYECIYNMVIRPEKSGIVSSVLPKELDVVLVGDLVFRNNIISFVVKGLDLIDENVEKFGELRIESAAACAIGKNDKNLPDYGLDNRDLYKPFLTRDKVLSLCENVYPIENPEKAIIIFEEWKKYVYFRKYFLNIQSQRSERIDNVSYIHAYSISRSEYRKNEETYESHLLDGNKNFIQKDQVLLDKYTEGAAEFSLIKVEISKNLAEINRFLARDKKISNYERDLRRFSRTQVALSQNNPCNDVSVGINENLLYLGNRVAFEAIDIEPDCEDIISFFEEKLRRSDSFVDEKYRGIIREVISEYEKKEDKRLDEEMQKAIDEYFESLDYNYEADVEHNTDKNIAKRYSARVKEINIKYDKQKKQLEKNNKMRKKQDGALEKVKQQFIDEIEKLIVLEKEEIANIPLSQWYFDRNEKLKTDFEKSQRLQKSKDLEALCSEKERLLKIQLASAIEGEKKEFKEKIDKDKAEEIDKKKERTTQRHFYIYFKAEDVNFDLIKTDLLMKNKFLIYDNRAEKKKIERQEKAIYSFYHGYVKNPFLASYFFVPETLGKSETNSTEIEWFENRLNDSQKEAVRRALASNSLFLLQGPPGTGKTEVIAEITAQFVKQGKKVLVSSETHKAIDNVFERLPKIPEIRPLRLVPSMSNKETEYSPEKLVDNLYLSISSRLDKRIQQYENFTEMKSNFSESMSELRFRHNQLLQLEKDCRAVQTEKENLQREISDLDHEVETKRNSKRPLEEEKEQYDILISYMDKGTFDEEIDKGDVLFEIGKYFYELVSKYDIFTDVDAEKVSRIYRLDLDQVRDEFKTIEDNSASMSVEQEKASIRSKINALRDPDTDIIFEGKEEEYEILRKQLISLKNVKDAESDIDYSSLTIALLITADKLSNSVSRANVLQELVEIKSKMDKYIYEKRKIINDLVDKLSKKKAAVDDEISVIKINKNNKVLMIEQLNEDNSYLDYRRKQQELRTAIVDFFMDFDIYDEYPADDFAAAIEIINRRLSDIERNQDALEKENKSRIPMYKAIRNYLADEAILEEDRVSYTKKLFDNANVFGMTCTSREYYSESSMQALREYKLGNINVRNVGIDVVIIDEVSKSSFLDLLIPVLYGKTVILVGDHRQLPPLYDLKHMRKGDFEGLNPEIIDYDLNQHYQKLYETCFFKELFEKVPNSYRIMLDKQYRCHSDIMDVFNHFYSANGKGLTVGLSNQNDLKQHNLLIKSNGVTLIEPHNHIHFVNCTEYESSLDSESSSKINRQEADVISKLLKLINEQYGRMIESGEIRKDSRKDERKSIGVICTYRDQARHIKNNIKGIKFPNVSTKRAERLIINTVDDFQGDERDIIIVSMVRNPRGDRYSTEFIDQFERINVALSRARCMLIIVGSQEFLSKSSIDLPDINGRKELDRHSFPVYKEIIRTIQAKGKILQASDIIGEVKKNGK
ncbi:superfamily I DNA and/or RNA helicase [Natranaerovirga pectinivora]|uniref:Superfamily I DNA and/or RNA helicase n=1 Tax=Natranaerovirga pectinivora TaxID=682400 RepID=A0A4R3MND1_9FIRM|nr:AAA domain-containing protein [Natranaerovirga pectinivora]TCT16010.1 superfamily I DNA and/or RNA helicase [Natranaerovirga pectinivora]